MRRVRAALQSSLMFPALASFARLTVHGRESLRELGGPAVFVANHVSALDAVVMAEALPPRYRHRSVVVAAADSIFKRKWEARLAQVTVDAFPIPLGGGARSMLCGRMKRRIRQLPRSRATSPSTPIVSTRLRNSLRPERSGAFRRRRF